MSHYDIEPVIDIYGSVDGRDLGGVARDMNRIIDRSAEGPARRVADDRARADADDEGVVHRIAYRAGIFDPAGLPADRREFSSPGSIPSSF